MRAVHVEAQRRAVVGDGQVRPVLVGQRAARRRPSRSVPPMMPPPPAARRWSDVAIEVVVVVALVDHVAPGAGDGGRVDPGLERHPGSSDAASRSSGIVDPALVPLKTSALPNLPAVVQVALATVPLLPFPDESATVVPEPSSNAYAATSAGRRRGAWSRWRCSSTGRGCRRRPPPAPGSV